MEKPGRFYRLSQEQWEQIKDCFHRRKGRKGFAPKVSNRKAFEAVLYRERTGCPWRDVPAFYGPWRTIAAQSDPAKLATLGRRQGNPRLKRIVFYLAQARDAGADPGRVIAAAQRANKSAGTPRAALTSAGLLRNLKIADGLGLLTADNRARLSRGNVPIVTRGPYAGQPAEVDHVVPLAIARELDHELSNLELLP